VISGIHAILYTRHAERVREFLSDILELPSVDAGGGWPIYAAPTTEIAVHPTESEPEHELFLICDDVKSTVSKLANRGIKTSPVRDQGWGVVTTIELGDGEQIGLYEPRHPRPTL
jgi:hypothetical protein